MGMLNRLLGGAGMGHEGMMLGLLPGLLQGGGGGDAQQQMPQQLPSWMASQGGAGLPPPQMPQMPPQPGGMNALQGAFSQSPQFQAQLGAIHNQTSPGYQPPQFTPPIGGPIPAFNGNAQSGGRIRGAIGSSNGMGMGNIGAHGLMDSFPGGGNDFLRRFMPQAPTRL